MTLSRFLSPADAERAHATLALLHRHGLDQAALTGGLAIELHLLQPGARPQTRPLNDIDFLVDSFDAIPESLSADLLFRHVHPHDPPAKTLLQAVAPETAVRIDFFRAYGATMSRTTNIELGGHALRIVSLADLTARTARLCMDLAASVPTPRKHAHDFLRLLPFVDPKAMERVWHEHRKRNYPESFPEAGRLLRHLIDTKPELQSFTAYSQDTTAFCPRCQSTPAFPLADPGEIQSLLGYC